MLSSFVKWGDEENKFQKYYLIFYQEYNQHNREKFLWSSKKDLNKLNYYNKDKFRKVRVNGNKIQKRLINSEYLYLTSSCHCTRHQGRWGGPRAWRRRPGSTGQSSAARQGELTTRQRLISCDRQEYSITTNRLEQGI